MGNLNLDDVRGFFRELVDPNFYDFYWDYQSEDECDRDKLVRVFRKMVNLCLTLNHQADKVAKALKYENALELIGEVSSHYKDEGAALDAVRRFSNDVKHKSKLDQNFTARERSDMDRSPDGPDLPEWYFLDGSGVKVAVCNASVDAYLFWGKYFAGERALLKPKT
ncbi:hypothetical protein [Marinobacter nauticus]|uniref:hypothetical protein n=1 Tax=Marinobacter nauticus TaxID=2743 RepID=UPI0037358257